MQYSTMGVLNSKYIINGLLIFVTICLGILSLTMFDILSNCYCQAVKINIIFIHKYYTQILYTNIIHKYYIQILYTNIIYKYYIPKK
jgi:hypothetical protein